MVEEHASRAKMVKPKVTTIDERNKQGSNNQFFPSLDGVALAVQKFANSVEQSSIAPISMYAGSIQSDSRGIVPSQVSSIDPSVACLVLSSSNNDSSSEN